jgi:hypothetical protein
MAFWSTATEFEFVTKLATKYGYYHESTKREATIVDFVQLIVTLSISGIIFVDSFSWGLKLKWDEFVYLLLVVYTPTNFVVKLVIIILLVMLLWVVNIIIMFVSTQIVFNIIKIDFTQKNIRLFEILFLILLCINHFVIKLIF